MSHMAGLALICWLLVDVARHCLSHFQLIAVSWFHHPLDHDRDIKKVAIFPSLFDGMTNTSIHILRVSRKEQLNSYHVIVEW